MKLVLLGAPGSGKGTQGERLSKKYNIPQLSTGEILRRAVAAGTKVGVEASKYMNKGELVPSAVIIDLMAERLKEADCKNGYILDGFPRTVAQAEGLGKILGSTKLDAVININVSEPEVVERLSGRRQCEKCGALYHVKFSPSKKGDACERCGANLFQRKDDKEETILNRMKVYKNETEPLVGFYRSKGLIKDVDGTGDQNKIFDSICSLIEKK